MFAEKYACENICNWNLVSGNETNIVNELEYFLSIGNINIVLVYEIKLIMYYLITFYNDLNI